MSVSQFDFQREVLESLTRLETQMQALVGNGQPGRIDLLEAKVDGHQSWIDKNDGAHAAQTAASANRHSWLALGLAGLSFVWHVLSGH